MYLQLGRLYLRPEGNNRNSLDRGWLGSARPGPHQRHMFACMHFYVWWENKCLWLWGSWGWTLVTYEQGMKLAPAHTPNAVNFCDWQVKLSIYLPRWRVATRSDTVVTANFHRGRERRVTAASRSPLLIAATLVKWEHFHRAAAERLSSGPGAARRSRNAIFT